MAIPKKVSDRLGANIKPFQAVLQQQKARDVSEADTVTVVKDMLCEVFGYDKYAELTSEHSIRGTFCDLAVKIDSRLAFLIEVKAIGTELKDSHVKQAIDYAANQGCEWVILTNGLEWRLYHVLFQKPIDKEEIAQINFATVSAKSDDDMCCLYLLTREGFTKSALAEFRDRKDATSRYMLAAIILNSENVRTAIRRDVRRISEISVDEETIVKILRDEVLKRETIEGDQAVAAGRRVTRSVDKTSKKDSIEPAAKSAAAAQPAIAPPPPSQG